MDDETSLLIRVDGELMIVAGEDVLVAELEDFLGVECWLPMRQLITDSDTNTLLGQYGLLLIVSVLLETGWSTVTLSIVIVDV